MGSAAGIAPSAFYFEAVPVVFRYKEQAWRGFIFFFLDYIHNRTNTKKVLVGEIVFLF